METLKKLILILIISTLTLSCSYKGNTETSEVSKKKPENAGTVLYMEESSETDGVTNVRMIITQNFLRVDEGRGSEDYILYNRKSKTIYNVVAEDSSIMMMNRESPEEFIAEPLIWQIEKDDSNALMRSDANKNGATHHKLKLNKRDCYNVVALNSFLGDEAKALSEYYSVLANELRYTFKPSQETQCFDAINIIEPHKRFSFGFPYREWGSYGYQRFLKNYQQRVIFPEKLFEVPKNYRQF